MVTQVSSMKVDTFQRKPTPVPVIPMQRECTSIPGGWQLSCCVDSWEGHRLLPRMWFKSAQLPVSGSEHSCHGQGPGYRASQLYCVGLFSSKLVCQEAKRGLKAPSPQCLP